MTEGPPPYDSWHPPDPKCDDGASAAAEQDRVAEMVAPGLMEYLERRIAMTHEQERDRIQFLRLKEIKANIEKELRNLDLVMKFHPGRRPEDGCIVSEFPVQDRLCNS